MARKPAAPGRKAQKVGQPTSAAVRPRTGGLGGLAPRYKACIMIAAVAVILLVLLNGRPGEKASETSRTLAYLRSFEAQFMSSLEDMGGVEGLARKDSTIVKDLIYSSPDDICVCFDVRKERAGDYYHADNHLSNINCSKYVKVSDEGTVYYNLDSITEGILVSSLTKTVCNSERYTIELNLIYAGDL